MKYLQLLEKGLTTAELSEIIKVTWWSVFKRLKELERLELIERKDNKEWIKVKTEKKILVV